MLLLYGRILTEEACRSIKFYKIYLQSSSTAAIYAFPAGLIFIIHNFGELSFNIYLQAYTQVCGPGVCVWEILGVLKFSRVFGEAVLKQETGWMDRDGDLRGK